MAMQPWSNRPSGYYTTSMPQLDREFQERPDAIQRGGQQASGYYHKSIRNDDVRRSEFGALPEDRIASSPDLRNAHRHPWEQSQPAPKQWHPIQRGNTQASGSFKRTLASDDFNRSADPMTSAAPLQRPSVNDRLPGPSRRPYPFDQSQPSDGHADQHEGKREYYYNFGRDRALPENRRLGASEFHRDGPHQQGHVINAGHAPTNTTWTTLPGPNPMTNGNGLDRVFEWEPTAEGPSNAFQNGPATPQGRHGDHPQELLNRNRNPEVLLQPGALLSHPDVPMGQSPPAGQHDALQANQNPNYLMSNGNPLGGRPDHQAPLQTGPAFTPADFPLSNAFYTLDEQDQEDGEKDKHFLTNMILIGVVVLLFVFAGVVVVILTVAV